MQNSDIKIGLIVGLIIMISTIVFQLIIGFTINLEILFYSVLFGFFFGVLSFILIKLAKLNQERLISQITVDLDEEESLIIEGAAQYHIEPNIYRGKLFLTSNRLIFKTIKPKHSVALYNNSLKNLKGISLKRNLSLHGKCLEIDSDLDHNKFSVDYPNDWKGIIENQIKQTQHANVE
ncbi:MAG: hypothetical protein BM563_01120 [Bacteroidetes bacterium MedPE-SWsnd-G1]|nr:MAG: hypothetical protein BM563_01120 [Bacteroidetes bacterium MedPE-SWsnd-G1]